MLIVGQCERRAEYMQRMNEDRQWKSEKRNRFDMYKKTTTICDIMYYDVLNKANIKKKV